MAKYSRWVIGTHAVLEAARVHSQWITEVAILSGKTLDPELALQLKKFVKITKIRNLKFFEELGAAHQGVGVALNARPEWEGVTGRPQLVAFLDGLNDPHNLGAILRTSWLLKVDALFIPKNRTVNLTPTASKVASGGAEHVPVTEVHFQTQIAELKECGFWIYGLSEKASQSLPALRFAEKTAIIVGAEGKGLRSSTLNMCDELVAIPQSDSRASLNASIAFALCAYEYRRTHP